MSIKDPVLHEVFEQWPAWQTIVGYLLLPDVDPRDVEPKRVADALSDMNGERLRRLAHLMVGYARADSLDEATRLLGEVWALSLTGRRPRFGAEAGIVSRDFEPERPS